MSRRIKKRSHIKNTLKESLRMAFEAIRDNKLRSSLTLLGIAIGVFSVIGVMTAIDTMESSINAGLNVFGSNTFSVQKYPAIRIGGGGRNKYHNRKNLTLDQFKNLKRRSRLPLWLSASDGIGGRVIKYKDRQTKSSTYLVGGDEWTLRVYNSFIGDGRNLSTQDLESAVNVAVLGMDAVDQLFPFEDPLGLYITIDGLKYRIIGTVERTGEMFGQSQDNYILIPLTTYLNHYETHWTSLDISVAAQSAELYEKTQDETIGLLRMIRKVPPGEENDFELVSNEELLATFGNFTAGIKLFAGAISAIALLVAGIGIMNIMLVSVTERIKEIGIRKAIGATRRDILFQFLAEAVFLSQIGGIVGVLLGIGAGNLVAMVFHIPAVIPLDWAIGGLVICSIIGISFGSYPAWRAAKLDPVESLRFE